MRVLIAEAMQAQAVARLGTVHEVVNQPGLFQQPEALMAAVRDCDALIVANRTPLRGALLDAMTRCRIVGRLGVGLDNFDLPACRERGIQILPATGANARSVAEYVITATLLLRRPNSYTTSDATAAGLWPRPVARDCAETVGATMGIVGFGSIGQLTARIALALGMNVVAHSRSVPRDVLPELHAVPLLSLTELLQRSDVVSLHVPMTPETRHLIGAPELALMRADAVLINTARGGIVDGAALVAALRSGHLRGAALDVFDTEPLPADSVFSNRPPNLLLSPHVGSSTAQSEQRVSDLVASRVLQALAEKQAGITISGGVK